jgi:hypothetical protein
MTHNESRSGGQPQLATNLPVPQPTEITHSNDNQNNQYNNHVNEDIMNDHQNDTMQMI